MSDAECAIPSLPSDAEDLLEQLIRELRGAAPDTCESLAAAARFSVSLLLPRFAGTMLKLLCEEGALPGTELMTRAARFQGVEPADPNVGFRLAVALDYLRRTGCVDATDSTIQISPFGREVYETRFGKTG
jgi:hypothetical protein